MVSSCARVEQMVEQLAKILASAENEERGDAEAAVRGHADTT